MAATPEQTFRALIEVAEEQFETKNQTELGKCLGITQPQVSNWKNRPGPTKNRWKKLFRRLIDQSNREVVWTIGEYVPVEPNRQGKSWKFFADKAADKAVAAKLVGSDAVYVFYDSARHPIYAGMTSNNLAVELRQRLNGDANRAIRQPDRLAGCKYGDLTRFISAYGVSCSGATKNIEVLLLRAFANALMNRNSGKFSFGR
jgi:hypothetical protein